MASQPPPISLFRIDDLAVDCAQRVVSRDGVEIPLGRLTFSLLETLVRAAPGVVTLDELMIQVWGDVIVSEETLTQRVSLLRQALDDDSKSPRYIKSVRGVGYRMIPAVEVLAFDGSGSSAATRGRPKWLAIAIGVVVVLSTVFVLTRPVDIDPPEAEIKVAVLPFEDISADQDQGYFADGMHDEIISRLAGLDAFSVVSRTSVMPYRGSEKSLREIGEELNADVILEGSVRRAGDMVRITAQLVDVQTDSHYFSESFERPFTVDNLFAIQSDVALAVANQFNAALSARNDATFAYLPTESLEAYNQLLLGRYHVWRGNPEDLRRAIAFFEAAIGADPDLAEAHAGLARAYSLVGTAYGWLPPVEAFALAEASTLRALELNPDLAAVHDLHGDVLTWYRWDWAGAEAAYLRARDLSENNTGLGYLILLSARGRQDEARAMTAELEARFPQDHWVRSNLGWRYLDLGDEDAAIEQANAALSIDDSYGDAYAIRGIARWRTGDYETALIDLRKNIELQSRSPWSLAILAITHASAGQEAEAKTLLDELKNLGTRTYVPADSIAAVEASLGHDDEALRWLAIAYDQRSRGLIFLNVHQVWDGLRDRSEFQDLLLRVGLR